MFSFACRDPNDAVPNISSTAAKFPPKKHEENKTLFWDTYEPINQLYLELGKNIFFDSYTTLFP